MGKTSGSDWKLFKEAFESSFQMSFFENGIKKSTYSTRCWYWIRCLLVCSSLSNFTVRSTDTATTLTHGDLRPKHCYVHMYACTQAFHTLGCDGRPTTGTVNLLSTVESGPTTCTTCTTCTVNHMHSELHALHAQ